MKLTILLLYVLAVALLEMVSQKGLQTRNH